MRARYLVVAGPETAAMHAALADRLCDMLPQAMRMAGLSLFTATDTPYILMPGIDGIVVGRLFSRDGREPVDAIPRPVQFAIESSGGDHLLKRFSGSYCALWQESAAGPVCLLRDPSATMPILYARCGSTLIVASDPDLIWASGLVVPRLDWEGLAHALRFPLLPTEPTCLERISAVQPGQVLRFGTALVTRQMWRPWSFAASDGDADPLPSQRRLAVAIDAAVGGWAACFNRISLELSGGLDSSILAAALAKTSVPWSGVNLVSDAADGDERVYAALVASVFGVALDEVIPSPDSIDPLSTPVRITPRPAGGASLRGIDRLMVSASDRAGAQAIFSGTGGDNVFCSIASTAPILDALRSGGPSYALRAAGHVASVTGTTSGEVAWHLAKRWLSGLIRPRRWVPNDAFLAGDVRPEALTHPWLDLPRGVAAGTRAHISGLVRIHPVLDAHDRSTSRTMVYPLLSQPVMEACLAIPSWQWIEGGRDRAVARAAFAGRLPDAIVYRRGKGRLDTMLVHAFDQARPQLRTLLCEGLLAAAGLLDRHAIATALQAPASATSQHHQRLLDLADAESWARLIRSYEVGGARGR